MKIITVSDPECGGKPTKYCAVLGSAYYPDELGEHVKKGVAACGSDPSKFDDHDIGVAWCNAMDRGWGWLAERFLVEITDVDTGIPKSERHMMEMAAFGLENGAITVSDKNPIQSSMRHWAANAIHNALKFALK